MSKIKAFGQTVDRAQAIEIICNDKVCEICYAGMEDALRYLMLNGWKALHEWSDKELEDYIADLSQDPRPNS